MVPVAVAGADVAAAIERAGAGNPLLGLGTGDGLPAARLCGGGTSGTRAAGELVEAVAHRLGYPERRVAASLVVLGYAARLVGPTLAVLLREGILLDAVPERVRYRYGPAGFALAVPEPAGWRDAERPLRAAWCATVLDAHLAPLIEAVRAVVPVAPGLLWGNVASGVTGTLRALAGDAVPAHRCHATGLALLDHGGLRGTGYLGLRAGRPEFRRRSCCLYYRLDGGGTCGDCPLSGRPVSDRPPSGRPLSDHPLSDCPPSGRGPSR